MARYSAELTNLLSPVIEAMGYELVGVVFQPDQRNALVRIYIDTVDGVSVDDCAAVSHQASALLDVEEPVPGHYTLEVSSPGLDRPLFVPEHFERFTGRSAKLHLRSQVSGLARRRLTGTLLGVESGAVSIELETGERYQLSLDNIEKARLVPEV